MTESDSSRERRRSFAANAIVVLGLGYIAFLRSGDAPNCQAVNVDYWENFAEAGDNAVGMVAGAFGVTPEAVRERAIAGTVECKEALQPEDIIYRDMYDIGDVDGECIGFLRTGPDGVVEKTPVRRFGAVCLKY